MVVKYGELYELTSPKGKQAVIDAFLQFGAKLDVKLEGYKNEFPTSSWNELNKILKSY